MKVKIEPYNSNWIKQFEIEECKIKSSLGKNLISIHHIGSTAIPELSAKPIIDIIVEIDNLEFEHKDLECLNYEYRGGFNLPLRKCFTYRSSKLNINLHIFEKNNPEIELNLLFCDHLKNNDNNKEEYEKLKYKLIKNAKSHQKDNSMFKNYTLGKHDFIKEILKKTKFNRLRFVICAHFEELNAAKKYRNEYIRNDKYELTFHDEDHKHFILYEGIKIIGYSHIQLKFEKRAIMHIIVIDKNNCTQSNYDKNYIKEFLFLIDKWLKLQNYIRYDK
ncbi:GrpB family protein [Candidatus Cytomitobacter indipagum]|nr:GrpB family protein [Candidatus Cytomitobacter indipagum]